MVRGFYQLGSGVLIKSKALSTISNNISNANTTGYKKQIVTNSTFKDMVISRVDGKTNPIGSLSLTSAVADINSIHSEGTLKSTDRNLDFAIKGDGFFKINTDDGIQYTRVGNFTLDEQGYLSLKGKGRVQGENGDIFLGTDNVTVNEDGGIIANGTYAGKLQTVTFDDYKNIDADGEGFYTATGAEIPSNASVQNRMLEGSNVNMGEEMTNALAAQRELQSCSQVLKMYDQVLSRAVTDIGKVR